MANPNEEAFEAEICAWLTAYGGYEAVKDDKAQGVDINFDRVTGLDRAELLTFLGGRPGRPAVAGRTRDGVPVAAGSGARGVAGPAGRVRARGEAGRLRRPTQKHGRPRAASDDIR